MTTETPGDVVVLALNCPRSRCDWRCGVTYPRDKLSDLRVEHKAHREEDWDTWSEEPVYMGIRRWVEHKVFLPNGERLGHWDFSLDGSMTMVLEDKLIMGVMGSESA